MELDSYGVNPSARLRINPSVAFRIKAGVYGR